MIGAEGVELLAQAYVAVLGLGGVGSHCALALARAGVGHLLLVDHDVVQESNLNRQALAFHSTLGCKKVDVAARMIADINPACRVDVRDCFVLPENLVSLFCADDGTPLPRPDYIVDCIDTVASKLAVALYAQERGLRLVSSMGAGNKFDPLQFRFDDIYDTSVCPLCKVMRKEARARGIEHLEVLYSVEKPVDVASAQGAARSERSNLGTLSYMPEAMGVLLASRVIRALL
ncbi:MAG: tRNA threonylcarbamoyladenosine dehydratase [Coriobacteriales bacterium]|nr:tRNA threonylcarbamoyladenosine dehydratase [Coriobacteriales bacterium]